MSPCCFLALGLKTNTNKKDKRNWSGAALFGKRGAVPVPYVDALVARRSTSHGLSLASANNIHPQNLPPFFLSKPYFSSNAKTICSF